MHPPRTHTPMMRIGFKKSAIVSLLVLTGASAILPGCKRPQELNDEAASAKLEKSQAALKAAVDQINVCKRAQDYYAFRDAYLAKHNVKVVPEVRDEKGKPRDPAQELPTDARGPNGLVIPSQASLAATEKKAEDDLLKVVTDLTTAAADKTITPNILVSAKMAAGNAECILADIKLSRIEDDETQIQHLLTLVKAFTGKLQQNNLAVQSLQTSEPKEVRDNIQNTIKSVNGDNDHLIWIAAKDPQNPGLAIPAQAGLQARIDDLNKQIATVSAEKKDLQSQEDEGTSQARKLEDESEHSTGKKSFDLFDSAAKLRKKAGETEVLIKNDNVKIASLQRDLSIATAQLETLKTAVTAFQATDKTFADGWTPLKARIDAIVAESQAIVGASTALGTGAESAAPTTAPTTAPSEPADPTTVTAAFEQIALLSKDLDSLRGEAKSHLEKADHLDAKKSHTGLYVDVINLNKKVLDEYQPFINNNQLTDSPTRPAWQWMVEIHNDADPTLQQALVQQRLARVYADEAYTAATLQVAIAPLVDVLGKANVTTPSMLAAQDLLTRLEKLKAQADEARTAAEQAFKDSDDYLNTIAPPGTAAGGETETKKALTQAARVARVIEQYGRAHFVKAFEDPKSMLFSTSHKNGADADAKTLYDKADDMVIAAKADALKLTSEGVPLPIPLPAEIAPPPGSATAMRAVDTGANTPGTQPTTPGPTTAPTETPTTPPATAPATPPTTQGAG